VEKPIEKPAEIIVKQDVVKQDAAKPVLEESSDDLPLHEHVPVDGKTFTTWKQAVDAFGAIKPGVSAMLDHVICIDFADKVRLALDNHQQRAIAAPDRRAFADWLGREVLWESRQQHHADADSLSQERARQARTEEVRLRKGAEHDPHVQALMQEMDAKLVKVLPAGVSDKGE